MLTLLFLLSCGEATKNITNTPATSKQPVKHKAKEYDKAKSEELQKLLNEEDLDEGENPNFMKDLKRLVSEGADPAQTSSDHASTALYYAIRESNEETIELLLNSAANKAELIKQQDKHGWSPLSLVLHWKDWALAKLLLKSLAPHEILILLTESDGKRTRLHGAAATNGWDARDALDFMKSVLGDSFDEFAMIQDEDKKTALHVAADRRNGWAFTEELFKILSTEAIQNLVMLQDSHGDTVLHIAARHEDNRLIKYILDNIVDVEARAQLEEIKNNEGRNYEEERVFYSR